MKFKKGDKVIWIGKKPEMYYLDLTVGKEYIVHSTIKDGELRDVVVYKEGDKGKTHCFMMEDNFTKAPERQPKAVKFNEGDVATIYVNRLCSHFKNLPCKVRISRVSGYDYKATCIDNPDDNWYVNDLSFIKPAAKKKPNENGSQGKLWLQVAKFADRKGNTTTIKRSPCRHYYIKRPGAKQVRATKAQVKAVLEQVAGNI